MNKNNIAIILTGIAWGFVGVITTQIFTFNFTVFQVVELRFLFSAIITLILLLFFNRKLLKPQSFFLCACVGICNFLTCVCYYKSIKIMGGGVACALLYSSPMIVTIYSYVKYKKPIKTEIVLAIVLCFAGSVISAREDKGTNITGLIWGLLSAVFNALVTIIGAKLSKTNKITAGFYGFLSASVVGLVFVRSNVITKLYSLQVNLWFIILAVGCTIIPYILYINALKQGEEDKASLLCASEPITANLIEIIIFKKVSITGIIGLICLIFGVLIINIGNKKGEDYFDKQIQQRSNRTSTEFQHGT